MTTIVQHYNKTGVIDLNLPWSLSEYEYVDLLEDFTDKQRDIYNRLVRDGLEVDTALVLCSRFNPLAPEDIGEYSVIHFVVKELIIWMEQPEGISFWIDYNKEYMNKYNPWK